MKSKIKSKTIIFQEIDDTFIILFKQRTAEFMLNHNNLLDCKCVFCKAIHQAIKNVGDKN